jgi:acetylglutamate kinase
MTRILIKLGGTLLDSPESLHRLAQEITAAASPDRAITVVHGGGKQMTRFLEERGVESRFVNGLRVTTPDIIDAVVKVFKGSVNASLVTALRAAGSRPVGISGLDGGLVDAEILNSDLGQVGKPVASDSQLLETLTAAGFLPIVACVAGDRLGQIFNVNADQMAVACAASFRANFLLFLTDVDGVKGPDGSILSEITITEVSRLVAEKVATGGMQAKLEAACDALTKGVGEVWIAPGARPGVIHSLLSRFGTGTKICK